MKTNENLDDALNPHRAEGLAPVNALVAERLRRRGIEATEDEDPDDLGDLPAREARERIRHYIKRIDAASELIRSHPSID